MYIYLHGAMLHEDIFDKYIFYIVQKTVESSYLVLCLEVDLHHHFPHAVPRSRSRVSLSKWNEMRLWPWSGGEHS